MAPLLINNRDLLKLVIISVLVTALAFASGFFIGQQRATAFYQAGSVLHSLALPEQLAAAEPVIDSQQPEVFEAGAEIDVDQPDTVATVKPEISVKPSVDKTAPVLPDNKAIATAEASKAKDTKTRVSKAEVGKTRAQTSAQQKKKSSTTETNVSGLKNRHTETNRNDNKDTDAVAQKAGSADALIVTTVSTDELSKIKYTIQVGVYGRLANAENVMKKLQTQRYDAYISDYTNSKNKTRYNVRYGYFSDKQSAKTSLDKFKNDKAGDGYLVKFSADNILDLAKAAASNSLSNVPAQADDPDNATMPATTPSENMQDKVSQADVLDNTQTKTN